MRKILDRADWSPVRAGTAIGKILSALLPATGPDRSGRRYLLAQQPWHIRSELIVASVVWSLLPVSLGAALIGQSLRSSAGRILLAIMVPLITPVLVQCSMLVVGGAIFVRRAGIPRGTARDGWIQAAAWGTAGTALALMAIRRAGFAHWLGLFWIGLLVLEGISRLVVIMMSKRLEAISRSREARG